jgi:hypothetical protein
MLLALLVRLLAQMLKDQRLKALKDLRQKAL